MNSKILLSVACLVIPILASNSFGQEQIGRSARSTTKQEAKITAAIKTVLDAQREAWNRGDIAGYMNGYHRSPEIVFISGDNLTRGWQTVFDRYQKNYDSREKMGTLTFSDLETTVYGNDLVVMNGRWHLQRVKDEPHGRFTLIFRRTREGWKIVHDHTSSA